MSATVQEPKFCPILSLRPTASLTGQANLTACQGHRCMFFLPVKDDGGEIVGGSCAITVIACEVNTINQREDLRYRAEQAEVRAATELEAAIKQLQTDGDHAPDEVKSNV